MQVSAGERACSGGKSAFMPSHVGGFWAGRRYAGATDPTLSPLRMRRETGTEIRGHPEACVPLYNAERANFRAAKAAAPPRPPRPVASRPQSKARSAPVSWHGHPAQAPPTARMAVLDYGSSATVFSLCGSLLAHAEPEARLRLPKRLRCCHTPRAPRAASLAYPYPLAVPPTLPRFAYRQVPRLT